MRNKTHILDLRENGGIGLNLRRRRGDGCISMKRFRKFSFLFSFDSLSFISFDFFSSFISILQILSLFQRDPDPLRVFPCVFCRIL